MRTLRLLAGVCAISTICGIFSFRKDTFAGASVSGATLAELRERFANPPDDCRIMVRWWWFGPSAVKPELARELGAMKAADIGGVELQPVYPLALDDPASSFHNSPYLSDEFLGDVRFAAERARALGLRFDLTLGSGWPYGGPHIPITEAAGKLRVEMAEAPPQADSAPVPSMGAGERLIAAFLQDSAPAAESAQSARNAQMLDLAAIRDGRLYFAPNGGQRTLVWFIASRTGMMVKRPAIGAEGFVLDHFDRAAIETHLHAAGDRLLAAFGDHPPYAVFSDSLEVYGANWTEGLLQEFQRRRGYDLRPHLLALVEDAGPETAAIRRDWGRTLTELIDENYLTPVRQWAARHGTRFRSQTYGVPAVTLSSNRFEDLPEGEQDHWRGFCPSRWAASASHLYGRPVTSAETWTWMHSPPWRATPLDFKADADLFFLQGVNQIVAHGWPYSAPGLPEPGWNFYAATAFNDHNPWWPVAPELARYLQRVGYALRQGQPANDVAILLPTDDAWAQFTAGIGHAPGNESVSEQMDALLGPNLIPQILDAGYDFDFIDADAIGQLGIRYPILVLPGIERLPLGTYRRIEEYARAGGIVIATRRRPSDAPGLLEAERDTPQIREISQRLFAAQAQGALHERAAGYFLADEHGLGALLAQHLAPDVATSPRAAALGFVHRKLPFADLYFLANTSNRELSTTATFRAKEKFAEWWDPFSGKISRAGEGASLPLNFQPYESRILVFTDRPASAAASASQPMSPQPNPPRSANTLDLGGGWTISFPKLHRAAPLQGFASWTADEQTRYYSGAAIYERDFALPAPLPARVWLDFGPGEPMELPASYDHFAAALHAPIRDAAEVYLNGQKMGDIWKPPYEIELSRLRPGTNHLRIAVYNLAINELAGRAAPDYRVLNSRYGERFAPQDQRAIVPLPSGILVAPKLILEPAR